MLYFTFFDQIFGFFFKEKNNLLNQLLVWQNINKWNIKNYYLEMQFAIWFHNLTVIVIFIGEKSNKFILIPIFNNYYDL